MPESHINPFFVSDERMPNIANRKNRRRLLLSDLITSIYRRHQGTKNKRWVREKQPSPPKIQLQISFLDKPLKNPYRTKKTAASRFLRSGKGFNPLLCLYFSFLSKTIFVDFEHLKIPETTNGWSPAA